MMKKLMLFLCMILLIPAVKAAEPNPSVKYIQRTMKALEESTAENPARVRVLFYGQSIVAQEWTKMVQQDLIAKYPTVKFTFQNNAIGGYTSERLVRTSESDLYPWYPDLLFFHVYGSTEKYEEIVRNVRQRTTAEIVLWTSHLNAKQSVQQMRDQRDQRSKEILAVADKYHCMVIDLNKKWCDLLHKNGWAPGKLLQDSIHLTPKGCKYYAQFISEEIVRLPGTSGEESVSGSIRKIALSDPAVQKNADHSVSVKFKGNRISAVSGPNWSKSANAKILLDGKDPAVFKDLWINTRTSCCPKWMPSIYSVRFNVPLIKEKWTLTALPDSAKDGKKIHYKVSGSITGSDGEGFSTEDFVSPSGRVVIPKGSFNTMFGYFKMDLPKDYKVVWQSIPLFADPYYPGETGEPSVLIQNCSNEEHVLTIIPTGKIDIEAFIVNTPAK
ncbi:MAG: hypothetical protein Q4G69_13585 [Planctomycetia bacterium]|nr:hypothetical protein [Planctomycetia bacterium]